jgi:hypothetical protein
MFLYVLMFTFLDGRREDKRKVLYRMTERIRSALAIPNLRSILGFAEWSRGSIRIFVNSDLTNLRTASNTNVTEQFPPLQLHGSSFCFAGKRFSSCFHYMQSLNTGKTKVKLSLCLTKYHAKTTYR